MIDTVPTPSLVMDTVPTSSVIIETGSTCSSMTDTVPGISEPGALTTSEVGIVRATFSIFTTMLVGTTRTDHACTTALVGTVRTDVV